MAGCVVLRQIEVAHETLQWPNLLQELTLPQGYFGLRSQVMLTDTTFQSSERIGLPALFRVCVTQKFPEKSRNYNIFHHLIGKTNRNSACQSFKPTRAFPVTQLQPVLASCHHATTLHGLRDLSYLIFVYPHKLCHGKAAPYPEPSPESFQ